MLGDDIAQALPEFRAQSESLMTDSCRITKPAPPDAEPVWDPSTGSYVDPAPVTVYEGPCRIPPRGTASTTRVNAGPESWSVGEYPFEIPVDGDGYKTADDVAPGQTVTYLSSRFDPTMVGRVFGIVDPVYQSQPIRRRFKIKAAVS